MFEILSEVSSEVSLEVRSFRLQGAYGTQLIRSRMGWGKKHGGIGGEGGGVVVVAVVAVCSTLYVLIVRPSWHSKTTTTTKQKKQLQFSCDMISWQRECDGYREITRKWREPMYRVPTILRDIYQSTNMPIPFYKSLLKFPYMIHLQLLVQTNKYQKHLQHIFSKFILNRLRFSKFN